MKVTEPVLYPRDCTAGCEAAGVQMMPLTIGAAERRISERLDPINGIVLVPHLLDKKVRPSLGFE
jgi:hypothetical protein